MKKLMTLLLIATLIQSCMIPFFRAEKDCITNDRHKNEFYASQGTKEARHVNQNACPKKP